MCVFVYLDNWEPRLARLDQSGYINAWMGRNKMSWIQVSFALAKVCSTEFYIFQLLLSLQQQKYIM